MLLDVVFEHILNRWIVEDVVMRHLVWQFSETVSLENVTDTLVEEHFDHSWVTEAASLMDRIVAESVRGILLLFKEFVVVGVGELFEQEKKDYLLLVVFNSNHERGFVFVFLS